MPGTPARQLGLGAHPSGSVQRHGHGVQRIRPFRRDTVDRPAKRDHLGVVTLVLLAVTKDFASTRSEQLKAAKVVQYCRSAARMSLDVLLANRRSGLRAVENRCNRSVTEGERNREALSEEQWLRCGWNAGDHTNGNGLHEPAGKVDEVTAFTD
jgi:hypothetical protein